MSRAIVGSPTFDLRTKAPHERVEILLDAYARLSQSKSLSIITEIEPRSLFARLYESHRNDFVWDQQYVGEREWVTQITRSPGNVPSATLRHIACCPSLFSVGAPALAILQRNMSESYSKRGMLILRRDEQPPYVGLLCDGLLAASGDYNGEREFSLYDVKPFEIFGAMEILDGGRSIANVRVLSESATYWRIDVDAFRDAIAADEGLRAAMCRLAVQRFRCLALAYGASLTLPMASRVALALLPFAAPEPGMQPALLPLAGMTQSQLAVLVGSVKEVVARTISALEGAGGLRRERGHIAFLDRSKLLELSERV